MKLKKYFYQILLATAVGTGLSSCIYETFPEEGFDPTLQMDGESLALSISLQSLTREGEVKAECEKYEDYINPELITLLFIYADEDASDTPEDKKLYDTVIKQFSGSDLSLIPIETTTTGDLRNWYVKLPPLDESEGFADILRNHAFKVAALVNWKNYPKENILEATIENGEITTPGSPLKKLHHLWYDSEYSGSSAFKFLTDKDGNMGLTENWVKDNFEKERDKSKPYSLDWIRENCKPKEDYVPEEGNYSKNTYPNLRLVWNFNAAYNFTPQDNIYFDTYDGDPDDFSGKNQVEWAIYNNKNLYRWLNDTEGDNNYLKPLEKITEDKGEFEYVGPSEGYDKKAYRAAKTPGGRVGVVLPAGRKDGSDDHIRENEFRFMLLASGKIFIKWDRYNNTNSKIIIERRNHLDDSKPTSPSPYTLEDPTQTFVIDTKKYLNMAELKVTGDSEYVSIYAEGGEAIIYEIEYVADQYLYETDRFGVAVGPENPIAMYGIQKYRALGNWWKKGTLFNLSDFNNLSLFKEEEGRYPDYDKIYLIRSVAKVELRIPFTFKEHDVYLRCVNRRARFEPMDVSTPTNELWKDHIEEITQEHPKQCEWFTLRKAMEENIIDPFYQTTSSNTASYNQALAWYYGSWAENNQIGGVTVSSPVDGYDYPHILNPRIQRSDFVRFINAGEAEGIYTKYILYVPEKFVDDPNDKGERNSSPKICHIEFRRGDMGNGIIPDPSDNVDDNNCYRIYFTENGFYSGTTEKPNVYPNFKKDKDKNGNEIGDYRTWENTYEQNVDNLRHHWPIMRNHVYSFVVEDTGNKVLVMRLEVLPWKKATQNSYIW